MTSWVPRKLSAASRSSTPSKWITSLPPPVDIATTVNGPRSVGSVRTTEPTAKRSSGSSVHEATKTCPRTPRGRPMRPIATTSPSSTMSAPVDVDHVDADALTTHAVDDLAKRFGGPAVAANHPTEVIGVHPDLQPLATPVVDKVDPHVVRMIDNSADEVIEGFLEHVSPPPGRPPQPLPAPLRERRLQLASWPWPPPASSASWPRCRARQTTRPAPR